MHNFSKTWSPWWTSFDHTLFTFTGPQYTCTFVRYIPPFARFHTSLAFTFVYTVYGIHAMLAWNSYMHTNTNSHHTAGTYAPWNVQTAGKAKQTWHGLTWSTLMSIFWIMRVWALFFLCVGGFSCALFETKALSLVQFSTEFWKWVQQTDICKRRSCNQFPVFLPPRLPRPFLWDVWRHVMWRLPFCRYWKFMEIPTISINWVPRTQKRFTSSQ